MKTKNLNFMEAVEAMDNRQKVKRANHRTIYQSIGGLICSINSDSTFLTSKVSYIKATDWEIVEEKKTLSDGLMEPMYYHKNCKVVADYEIKEAVREFGNTMINEFERHLPKEHIALNGWTEFVRKKAKEIFGDDLV